MIALFWAAVAYGQTPCADDTVEAVVLAMGAVDQAWDRNDEPAFDTASKALTAAIACLDAAPAASQVAKLHQAMALTAFVNGQMGPCRRSLAAARRMDPAWTLPEATFPPSHPFVALHAAATEPGPVQDIGDIRPERWVVDGMEQDEAPSERAFLLQISKAGAIVWSGYLWDLADLPDRGAEVARGDLEPPHQGSIALSFQGGALIARQAVEDGSAVPADTWDAATGTILAGGAELVGRFQPVTVIGVELAAGVVGPADPILGGGASPSARGVLLVGGAWWIGQLQPYAAARVGGGVGQVRAWTGGSEEVLVFTVPSLLTGVEAGARTDQQRIGATVDADVVFDSERPAALTAYRIRVDGGHAIAGPLAIEALAELRRGMLPYVDQQGDRIGLREDLDLRLGLGVALWY